MITMGAKGTQVIEHGEATPVHRSPDASKTRGNKRQKLRRRIYALLTFLVFWVVIGLLGPMLISTSIGTLVALSIANGRISGSIHIDDLSVTWFGGQRVVGLRLTDHNGKTVLELAELDATDLSLWSLLRNSTNLGNVRVIKPTCHILQYDDGTTNLIRAVSARKATDRSSRSNDRPPRSTESKWTTSKFRIKLDLLEGHFSLTPSGEFTTIDIAHLALRAEWVDPRQIRFVAQADVSDSHSQASGSVDADVSLTDMFSAQGKLQLSTAKIDFTMRLTDIPIAAISHATVGTGALTALIGPVLNCELLAKGNLTKFDATLRLQSDHLNSTTTLAVRDGQFALMDKPYVQLKIDRPAWTALTSQADRSPVTQLLKPFTIELMPTQLSGPISGSQIDWSTIQAAICLNISDVALDLGPDFKQLTLTATKGNIKFNGPDNATLAGSLQSTASYSGKTGGINVSATMIQALSHGNPADHQQQQMISINGSITRWPLIVFDELFGSDGLFVAALGDAIDATIKAELEQMKGQQSLTGSFTFTANSTNLNTRIAGKLEHAQMMIEPGTIANFTAQPGALRQLIERYSPLPLGLAEVKPASPTQLAIVIQQLVIPFGPLAPGTKLGGLPIDAVLTFDGLMLTGNDQDPPVVFKQTTLGIKSLGKDQGMGLSLDTAIEHDGEISQFKIVATAFSTTDENGCFRQIKSNLQSTFTDLSSAMIDQFLASGSTVANTFGPTISGAAEIDFDANRTTLSGLAIHAKFAPLHVAVTDGPPVVLNNLKCTVDQTDLRHQPLHARIWGEVIADGNSGNLNIDLTITHVLADHRHVQVTGKLESFPVMLIDSLTQRGGLLTSLAGDFLNEIEFDIGYQPSSDSIELVKLRIADPNLKFDVAGQAQLRSGGHITLRPGASAKILLKQQHYDEIQQRFFSPQLVPQSRLVLTKLATINVLCERMRIGLTSSSDDSGRLLTFDPASTHVVVQISVPVLSLRQEQSGRQFELQNFVASFNAADLRQSATLHLASRVGFAESKSESLVFGTLLSNTTVSNLIGETGQIDLAAAHYDTNTQVNHVPTKPFDVLINGDDTLSAILGSFVTLKLDGTFSKNKPSDVDFELFSDNVQIHIPARIGRNVTLRDNVNATLRTTEQLGPILFKWGNPLLVDLTDTAEPIKLAIKSEGFRFPIQNFNIRRLRGDFELQLGQATLEDSWLISSLIPQLSNLGKILPLDHRQTGRFTTLKVHIEKGVATSNDLWFETHKLLVGVQGKVNLVKQRVNMVIGITGKTFRAIPIISQGIPVEGIYELPMEGPINDLKKNEGSLVLDLLFGSILNISGMDPTNQKWQWPNKPVENELLMEPTQDKQSKNNPLQKKTTPRKNKERKKGKLDVDEPIREMIEDLIKDLLK